MVIGKDDNRRTPDQEKWLRRHLEHREALAQAQRTRGQRGTHKLSEAWSV